MISTSPLDLGLSHSVFPLQQHWLAPRRHSHYGSMAIFSATALQFSQYFLVWTLQMVSFCLMSATFSAPSTFILETGAACLGLQRWNPGSVNSFEMTFLLPTLISAPQHLALQHGSHSAILAQLN